MFPIVCDFGIVPSLLQRSLLSKEHFGLDQWFQLKEEEKQQDSWC